ncbi:MAG: site-2 protease family protein [Methanobacteriota archaeon]
MSSITIGRVRGIPLYVHWTFLLVLPLFAFLMGRAYFAEDPDQGFPGIRAILWGGGLALFLFGTVLLHELGHSLTAIRHGVGIRHITLLPIGGVSVIQRPTTEPREELMITLMGPLVNFVIAGPLVAAAWALTGGDLFPIREQPDPVKFLAWAGFLNLFIGAFNMFVPAFPMDGGRILRAFLASRVGLRKATRVAAGVGRILAFVMGLVGLAIADFFLILIAFFVWMGASEEERSVAVVTTLGDLRVGDVMTRDPETVRPDATVSEVFERMLATKHLAFPVLDGDRPIGTVHLADLARVRREEHDALLVADVCRRDFPVLTPDAPATEALPLVSREESAPVLVLDRTGRLVGLLTNTDVVRTVQILSVERGTPGTDVARPRE